MPKIFRLDIDNHKYQNGNGRCTFDYILKLTTTQSERINGKKEYVTRETHEMM